MLRPLLQELFNLIFIRITMKRGKSIDNRTTETIQNGIMVLVRSISHAPVLVWLIKWRRMKLVNNPTRINVMGNK